MNVNLHRAYKFRLYPTEAQAAELAEWERQLRWLYNLAHEQRLMALQRPREERPRVDYFRQSKEMTEIVRVDPQLAPNLLRALGNRVARALMGDWVCWMNAA